MSDEGFSFAFLFCECRYMGQKILQERAANRVKTVK